MGNRLANERSQRESNWPEVQVWTTAEQPDGHLSLYCMQGAKASRIETLLTENKIVS